MQRREFITLAGGAAAWPLAVRAQQPTKAVIGYLSARSPGNSSDIIAAFRQGLNEVGFAEGRSLTIEFRFAPVASPSSSNRSSPCRSTAAASFITFASSV
jgi:putative ABC transport system substrate-binding protein